MVDRGREGGGTMRALIVKSLILKNMEPKHELPPANYTPEKQAELEKSRTISDAELLKGGAEYVVSEKEEKENLLGTQQQKEDAPMVEHWEAMPPEKFRLLNADLPHTLSTVGRALSTLRTKKYEEACEFPGEEYHRYLLKNPEKLKEIIKHVYGTLSSDKSRIYFFGQPLSGTDEKSRNPHIPFVQVDSKGVIYAHGTKGSNDGWGRDDRAMIFAK